MNSRKLFALFLVFALTGSALAAQQQRLYRGSADGDAEASGVVAVQQHTVFVEIVVEEEARQEEDEIHKFAAVVGLIKKCQRVQQANIFDNAVLWFNDQFLFGEKRNESGEDFNKTPDSALGNQPANGTMDTNDDDIEEGFIGTNPNGTPRWGGCYTPNGFAHAIGADDPFGQFNYQSPAADGHVEGNQTGANASGVVHTHQYEDNMDMVKDLMSMDQDCDGCIFEYQSSFFVVDPNGHRWIVDKYIYPLSVLGNLFTSGKSADCGSSSAVAPFTDPRQNHGANECDDEKPPDNDEENHKGGSHSGPNSTLSEPLFSAHLQVNPQTLMGYADKASYRYTDAGTTGDTAGIDYDGDGATESNIRRGAIYPGPDAPNRDDCEALPGAPECALEYNFLLAVDFQAFDDGGTDTGADGVTVNQTGEDEIQAGCSKEHGTGGADNGDQAWQGNSHPHNPNSTTAGPSHCHATVNLDVFFHTIAPDFTMDHPYWDEHGVPVAWTADCESMAAGETAPNSSDDSLVDLPESEEVSGTGDDPISVRVPLVCDADRDASEYHSHSGNETIRGS